MTDFITSFSSGYDRGTPKDNSTTKSYTEGTPSHSSTSFSKDEFSDKQAITFSLPQDVKFVWYQQNTGFVYDNDLKDLNVTNSLPKDSIFTRRVTTGLVYDNGFNKFFMDATAPYSMRMPAKKNVASLPFCAVDVQYTKPFVDKNFQYLPSTDFNIRDELIGFTTDFVQPYDVRFLKTKLSPVMMSTGGYWDKHVTADIQKSFRYGYSKNNFLVGGSFNNSYVTDDDAINPPVEPVPVREVIRLVNIVNVVKLPERTPVKWHNFTLARDLDSMAWVANFDISDSATYAMLKPTGLTPIEVEIDINGELFLMFVGYTQSSVSGDRVRGAQRNYKITLYSTTKLLTYPYKSRRSHNENSSTTPAGIVNDELLGSGFTGTWSAPSWTIPANVFSYFEKSPMAAISEVAEAVGAVIEPALNARDFSIVPRYEVSPWNWATATVDRTINEAECFTVDSKWEPREKPDSIYVYGEDNGGAAVKCVRQGTAGLVTLPTVVNKYITDTIAGTERGRIEVAKEHIDERVPITTFVDAVNGIIKPRELLEINPADGGAAWRGTVSLVSLRCERQGTAIVQSIEVERFYE